MLKEKIEKISGDRQADARIKDVLNDMATMLEGNGACTDGTDCTDCDELRAELTALAEKNDELEEENDDLRAIITEMDEADSELRAEVTKITDDETETEKEDN